MQQAEAMKLDPRTFYAVDTVERILAKILTSGHVSAKDRAALENIQGRANPTDEDREDQVRGEEPPA